ncbi:hypothetical protein LB579_33875, partial [Mesorhizobium sp. BR1-1-7]|uniref:hypothetical protein n=1 Tax=Mesorhizobium sp. BR1-1-7 TaxID=2876647 RepID=UPI001CC911FB
CGVADDQSSIGLEEIDQAIHLAALLVRVISVFRVVRATRVASRAENRPLDRTGQATFTVFSDKSAALRSA